MSDLPCEEADVFALHVLPEGHLQQRQSHVERLHDVTVGHQRVLTPQRLTPRHLGGGGVSQETRGMGLDSQ